MKTILGERKIEHRRQHHNHHYNHHQNINNDYRDVWNTVGGNGTGPPIITTPLKSAPLPPSTAVAQTSATGTKKRNNSNFDRRLQIGVHDTTSGILNRKIIGANWRNFLVTNNLSPFSVRTTNRSKYPSGVYPTKQIAIDCEMVGVGYLGKTNMLARVSIVNKNGAVLLDKYIKPRELVVDYRTRVSGIRHADLANGEDFFQVRQEVFELLENRILIGHALYNDLKVLLLNHPPSDIRDTSKFKPLIKMVNGGATPSLKMLAHCVLGCSIQQGEHSSVEDARAAMSIYNKFSRDWEVLARRKSNQQR